MPLSYDKQQRVFVSSISEALRRECPWSLVQAIGDGQPERWREIWDHIVALELPALLIPESDGGLGLGAVDAVAALETVGRFALPAPVTATVGAFVPLVVATQGGAARSAVLERIVSGASGTIAPTVDDDGALSAAEIDDRGLTVTCQGVAEPTRAELLAIPAERDGSPVLAVLETCSSGLTTEAAMDPASPVGVLSSEQRDLNDVVVLTGDPRPAMPLVWTLAAAELVGLGAEIIARSVDYARERTQFGKPIGAFQSIKHLLVDAHMAVERARSLTLYAAILIDRGDTAAARGAHLAKAAASEAATHAARAGVQVHGGSGITRAQDVSAMYLRARQLSGMLGNADFHYLRVGASL